jgi:hypothetical protein
VVKHPMGAFNKLPNKQIDPMWLDDQQKYELSLLERHKVELKRKRHFLVL